MATVRILLDYRPALRERSGVGEYVHQLARALARRGAEPANDRREVGPGAAGEADTVELFTSSWKDRPDPAALAELDHIGRVIDRRVPVRLLNAAWHRLQWPPVELLAGRSYDVVHSPHPLIIPTRRAARVVTIHDLDFLLHPERTRDEVRRDYPALVRRHARTAEAVVVPSACVGRLVVEKLGLPDGRVWVCPEGGPEWQPDPAMPPGNPTGRYVLFLGTLEPRKNISGLLEAYAALCTRRPETPPLVLAGRATGDAERWLEAITRPPLAGRVEYRGYVPDALRRSLYEGARALVLPSFEEGFGLPVVEAMTLGIPVIASNRGALPEVSGGAAALIDPDDRGSISHALEQVLFDPDLARRLGERGLYRAGAFRWERTAALTREAYEAAIERRRGRP